MTQQSHAALQRRRTITTLGFLGALRFSGGMGETKESDNYGLLGAIVVAPSGAEFFFKLTAPSKAVKAARKPFYKLLDSVRVEKPATPPAGAKPAEPATAAPGAAGSAAAAPHP